MEKKFWTVISSNPGGRTIQLDRFDTYEKALANARELAGMPEVGVFVLEAVASVALVPATEIVVTELGS